MRAVVHRFELRGRRADSFQHLLLLGRLASDADQLQPTSQLGLRGTERLNRPNERLDVRQVPQRPGVDEAEEG